MFGILFELIDILFNPIKFISDVVRDGVVPSNGAVVYCKIGPVEHTGIYLKGYRQILHRNRHGHIELVPPEDFTFNYGDTIYVSSYQCESIESSRAADRALNYYKSATWEPYDIVTSNCHKFTAGCITGDFNNNVFTFFMLDIEMRLATQHNNWRTWKVEDGNYLL